MDMELQFGLGTPYYYIFLAVSCLIGRALNLAYLQFFRGKRLLIGETTARSVVIISFFFIVLSFTDDLLVTKFDLDINTATTIMKLSGLFLSMWGDYLLESIINFPTLMSSLYKALCLKMDKEYKEQDNPFNTSNPHKEEHKELLFKISSAILKIEDYLIRYRKSRDDALILECYREVAPEYLRISFEYEYIPQSDVEGTLEKQMKVLEFSYGVVLRQKEKILLNSENEEEELNSEVETNESKEEEKEDTDTFE